MPITDDTIALIANRKAPEKKPRSMAATVLTVAGLAITIFGIIPAIRGTNVKRAWDESGEEGDEL